MTIKLEMDNVMEGIDPSTTCSPLKRQRTTKRSRSLKKTKASKLDREPITLTEGGLCDIGDIVREATKEVLDEDMTE